MDTQSVTPVVGQPSGPVIQDNAQVTSVGARGAGGNAPTESAKSATTPSVAVRTRDPRSLQFQVDSSTKQVVAQIVDESDQVVVVQIPDAEVLRIAQAIDRMKGFLLEGKA